MSKYIIETKNLTKNFGNFTAVKGVDLKVPQGGIYGFLGPNGAGKSTTIRMLLGLISATQGDATLFGKSIENERIEILKKVGSMVESPSYYGHLTSYENLNITREILKVEKSHIDRVLNIVGLSEVRNKKVKEFSLGMKQRLGIAQALIGNPQLLILDEPTNGLDPEGIREIRNLIRTLPEEMGITVLISSHLLSEIELMATHVGIINKGSMIFQGTLEELRRKSTSEVKIVAEPMERVVAHLNKLDYKAVIREHGIFINQCEDIPNLVKELVLNNFKIYHISENKSTLEDIFLNITGGEKAQ